MTRCASRFDVVAISGGERGLRSPPEIASPLTRKGLCLSCNLLWVAATRHRNCGSTNPRHNLVVIRDSHPFAYLASICALGCWETVSNLPFLPFRRRIAFGHFGRDSPDCSPSTAERPAGLGNASRQAHTEAQFEGNQLGQGHFCHETNHIWIGVVLRCFRRGCFVRRRLAHLHEGLYPRRPHQ